MALPTLNPSKTKSLQAVQTTPFACSSATELSGGLANATYRGALSRPLHDGTDSVIIKHGEDKCAKLPEVALSTNRCITEQALLRELQNTPVAEITHGDVTVQCPRVYHYIPEDNTQIVQDYAHECTLHEWLTSPGSSSDEDNSAEALGKAVGIWLARFHEWSSKGVNDDLARIVETNTHSVGKDISIAKMEKFKSQCTDEKVRRYAEGILFGDPDDKDIMIHGDFSTRNILLRDTHSPNCTSTISDIESEYSLAIIDWEISCYASYTRDLANILSDVYMQQHFTGSSKPHAFMNGLASAYPRLSKEDAYRVVAQIGENFFYAHAYAPEGCTDEQIEELVRFGERLITMGVEGDQDCIKGMGFGYLL
ncbi:kinase-like domain-containing protein [Aspergillus unguis]